MMMAVSLMVMMMAVSLMVILETLGVCDKKGEYRLRGSGIEI